MIKRFAGFLVFLLCLTLCLVAVAQDATVSPDPVAAPGPIATLLHGIFMAVATVAAAALIKAAAAFAASHGINLTAQQEDVLKGWFLEGASFAEEWAVKSGSKGERKMSVAVKYVQDRLRNSKLPQMTDAEVKDRIHATLPTSPFGAIAIDGLS